MADVYQAVLGNKLLKESIWALLSKGTAFLAFYALQIYLVRSMSVADWGLWAFFSSLLSIVLLVSDFGINLSSKKFIAQQQSSPELSSLLRQSLLLRLAASLAASVVFWIGQGQITRLVGRPELGPLITWVPAVIFFYSVLDYFKACSEGFHRLRFNFILVSVEHWGKLLFLTFCFSIYGTLGSLGFGLTFAYAIAAAAGLLLFRERFFRSMDQGSGAVRAWTQVLGYSFPLFMMLLIAFGTLEVDTIMLNYLRGDYETGIYAAARQMVVYIPHVTLALTMGTMPVFARMSEGDREEYRLRFLRIQKVNTGVILAILLGVGGAAPFLLPFLYGAEYRASVVPLLCLLPYVFFISHGLCSGALLDYRGKAGRRAMNLAVTFVANLILNYLLIPRWGATGGAIATSIAYFPYFLLNRIYARREFEGE